MTRAERAKNYFESGYNCSQSVAMAFADVMEMDVQTVAKMASGLGGGIGRLREVCGAVTGMTLAAGTLYGFDEPDGPKTKTETDQEEQQERGVSAREKKAELYALVQKLAGEFKAETGSIICRELLAEINSDTNPAPEARTANYYEKRPCAELVYTAARILEAEMAKQSDEEK